MKLTTYQHRGNISIGKVEGDRVIDLPRNDPAVPRVVTLRPNAVCRFQDDDIFDFGDRF